MNVSWFQTYTYQRTYLHIFLKGKGTVTVHLNISNASSVTYLDRQFHTALIKKSMINMNNTWVNNILFNL